MRSDPKERPNAASAAMDAWEKAYTNQGRIWGGAPFPVENMPDAARVLEMGCGSGRLLAALAGKASECIGFDFSRTACRLSRQAVSDPGVTILTADACHIPIRPSCIDVVVAYHIVGHQTERDRTALCLEAARVLRKGGQLIFCDFSEKDFRAGRGQAIEDRTYLRGNGIITHYFTEEEIRSIPGPFRICSLATVSHPMVVSGKAFNRSELVATYTRL
ncbi:MAG TPA: class I SAM-dependent methyltransferase [Methanoregulaceae archaeon]|nr:class I SAM-dependent methyltransferase [Methanoregulaceae archaeon]HPD75720.1 class I SAM-dependent methyltransferase [Methanoregulaceae archaeon]